MPVLDARPNYWLHRETPHYAISRRRNSVLLCRKKSTREVSKVDFSSKQCPRIKEYTETEEGSPGKCGKGRSGIENRNPGVRGKRAQGDRSIARKSGRWRSANRDYTGKEGDRGKIGGPKTQPKNASVVLERSSRSGREEPGRL